MGQMVLITPESTREDLITCLGHLNAEAKAERRRGYAGVRGERYAMLQANIDLILCEIEKRSDDTRP